MHYDPNLVLLSVLVAIVAAHAALDLNGLSTQEGKRCYRWLAALIFGTGIWTMHFLGMLACRKTLPIQYDGILTVLSLAAAVATSLIVFHHLGSRRPGNLTDTHLLTQSAVITTGIAGMHYLGMAALRIAPPLSYDPLWVAASLAVALGAAWLALAVGHGRLRIPYLPESARITAEAVLLGGAVSTMHYTAMTAVRVPPNPHPIQGGWMLGTDILVAALVFSGVFIAAVNLLSALSRREISPLRILTVIAVTEMTLMLLFPAVPLFSSWQEALIGTGVLLALGAPLTWRLHREQRLYRRQREETETHLKGQRLLNRLLQKRLSDRSLREILDSCLAEILSLPWLPVLPQGGIFLFRAERKRLELFVQRDMPIPLLTLCREVPLGQCLCGQAALERRLLHAAYVDERHTTHHPDMQPHGHYNVPLVIDGDLLGILVLYLEEGHEFNENEAAFLDALGGTLALLIDRWRKGRSIHQMAFYDPLTKLPNRVLLEDRFRTAMARSRREGGTLALLFLDLDHFKQINDILGHRRGDLLLQQVTQRLKKAVRETDTIARLGGDEFILLLENLETERDRTRREIEKVCRKLLQALQTPFLLEDRSFTISASIGIALFPEHGDNLEALMQAADTAMYEAKRQGRKAYHYYDVSLHSRLSQAMNIRQALPAALEQGQFHLHFQPQFDIHKGTLIGAEALLRWRHPEQGDIPPAQFIPIAESDGFILQLGEWILEQVCRYKRHWKHAGLSQGVRIGINLSLTQLIHRGEHGIFAHHLEKVLADTGIGPEEIELELTESLFAHQDHPILKANIDYLKRLGVSLAMDDFGTGHSSLGRLKFFPINRLKVDRAFVRDLAEDSNDLAIIRAVVAMGHHLDMEVVAEGVETRLQLAILQEIGCDAVQGYLTGRPMPPEEFEQRLSFPDHFWPPS